MKTLNELHQMASDRNIRVLYFPIVDSPAVIVKSHNLCAIGINKSLTKDERREALTLCHELGHDATGTWHENGANEETIRRGEWRTKKWVVHTMIPFCELQKAFEIGCTELWEIAEYLNADEDLVLDALEIYEREGIYSPPRPKQ